MTGTEFALLGVLGTSFLSSTALPGSSEAALFAALKFDSGIFWPALAAATFGNTAGGMTTYLIGRYGASRKPLAQFERLGRFGLPLLLFAWLPVVGDGFCLAAGWTRLNWAAVALVSAAGRFLRYWAVAQGALW